MGGKHPDPLAALLERFLSSGDEHAMEELVDRTRPRLLAAARRIAGPADAEDTVQTAYHSLLRKNEVPRDARLMAWLFTAVVRIAYRHRARRQRDHEIVRRLGLAREPQTPGLHAGEAEELALLRREVDRLPSGFRDVVVLHYLEGLTAAEAGKLLGLSETAVRQRLHRARRLLHSRLSPRFKYGLLFLPWLLADSARASAAALVVGGVMKAKTALVGMLLLGALLGAGLVWRATRTDEAVERTAGPPPKQEVNGRAEASSVAADDDGSTESGWFASWRSVKPGEDGCQGVSIAMRPLTTGKAAGLSDEWIFMLLRCHCAARVALSQLEIDHLLGALRGGSHPPLTGQHAVCVLRLLVARPNAMNAESWGKALAAAGETRSGGVLRAHADMVAVIAQLLSAHPVEDVAWWKSVWSGLPAGAGAVHARKAVYEAVAKELEPESRDAAWRLLASFEDTRQPNGNTALGALGFTMRGHISTPVALESMMRATDPNWKRALLWSLDESAMWPQRRSETDSTVARSVLDTLRSAPESANERFWRLDLIGRAWGILGPTLAVQEFEEFTTRSTGDVYEAALRVAVLANEVSENENSSRPEDQLAFDKGERVLASLMASQRYPVNHLVSVALTHSMSRKARDVVTRALGPRLHTLPKGTYARLVR